MDPKETPSALPLNIEEVVEKALIDIDAEFNQDEDVKILNNYQVYELNEEDVELINENGEVIEETESEDAYYIFEKHSEPVFCGSFSNDGKYVVTGGQDDRAYVWDAKTGEVILECTNFQDSVIFADFSYDDKYLAIGDMNGKIEVRKTSDKTLIWNFSMGDALWMQWHPKAHILLAGSEGGEINMWKIPNGECKVVQGYGKRAESACLMTNGKQLVVGYEDGAIRIIDLKNCTVTYTIQSNAGHSSTITAIDCHVNNNIILTSSYDGKTIISSASTGKIISILQDLTNNINGNKLKCCGPIEHKNDWVESATFLKDNYQKIAATGTINGNIYIWDVSKEALRNKIDQGSGVTKLLWRKNTSLIFSAALDGIIRCYDAKSGECKRMFLGHTEEVLDISLSKNGNFILTTCEDTTARIFQIDEK